MTHMITPALLQLDGGLSRRIMEKTMSQLVRSPQNGTNKRHSDSGLTGWKERTAP